MVRECVIPNMMGRAHSILTTLAMAAILVPATVQSVMAAPAAYDFMTKQTDVMSAGEYDGRLKIRIGDDGIVTGTFWDTEGHFSGVSGGLDGTKLWIDLGSASPTGRHLFTGTLIDGKLVATAPHGLHTWTLENIAASH